MTRLIDADALKENIIDLLEIEWGYEGIREDVSRIIDSMPTTEERPHGEWIIRRDKRGKHIYSVCSRCNVAHLDTDFPNFCPNCGADMREGDERSE